MPSDLDSSSLALLGRIPVGNADEKTFHERRPRPNLFAAQLFDGCPNYFGFLLINHRCGCMLPAAIREPQPQTAEMMDIGKFILWGAAAYCVISFIALVVVHLVQRLGDVAPEFQENPRGRRMSGVVALLLGIILGFLTGIAVIMWLANRPNEAAPHCSPRDAPIPRYCPNQTRGVLFLTSLPPADR